MCVRARRNSSYDAAQYGWFRDCNVLSAAYGFARSCRLAALTTLLALHADEIGGHELSLIEAIPETVPPELYSSLLPSLSAQAVDEDGGQEEAAGLVAWYCQRVRALDDNAGQLKHAEALANLGLSKLEHAGEHALAPLRSLRQQCLELLTYFVYDKNLTHNSAVFVSLAEWEALSFQDKVCKMLEGCSEKNIVTCVRA